MKLSELHLKNYRGFTDVTFQMRDLMVIIGPNGVGKTAVLELFELLRQASQQEMAKFFETRGGFYTVLNHSVHAEPTARLAVALAIDVESEKSTEPMLYRFELAGGQVGYVIAAEQLEWRVDPTKEKPFRYLDVTARSAHYADPQLEKMVQPEWTVTNTELMLAQMGRTYREPDQLRTLLGGVRSYSFLDVSPRSVVRLPQALTPVTLPGPNGENLFSTLYNLSTQYDDIYGRIEEILQACYPSFRKLAFPVVGAGQVTMAWYEADAATPFYPGQLSEGTLRFIWLITTLLSPTPPPILLLDEPEVSLHPELMKYIAALLQEAALSTQIIVATHSPQLIRWLEPNEVIIADRQAGTTQLTWADQLPNLSEWLEEYTLSELWLMGNLGGRL